MTRRAKGRDLIEAVTLERHAGHQGRTAKLRDHWLGYLFDGALEGVSKNLAPLTGLGSAAQQAKWSERVARELLHVAE